MSKLYCFIQNQYESKIKCFIQFPNQFRPLSDLALITNKLGMREMNSVCANIILESTYCVIQEGNQEEEFKSKRKMNLSLELNQ